jgi:Asp-tRNA(Asn)/Glu-tRNA(Gln) amidotransferase A subunit family amidase
MLSEGLDDPYPQFCCGTYFTALANVSGMPALTLPCGFSEGLPVGLQVIAAPGREDLLLRIARAAEQVLAPRIAGRRPKLPDPPGARIA